MAFRRGTRRFVDPLAGPLAIPGDGYAAAGELVTLVVTPEVQRFLAMTADEIAAARRTVDAYRATLSALYADADRTDPDARAVREAVRHASGALQTLVGSERFDRLRALSWRILGGDALLDDDVAALLDLSAAQRRDISARSRVNERETTEAFREYSHARLSSVDDLHDRMAADDAARSRTLLDVLTPAQHVRFEELQAGAPLTGGPRTASDDQQR